MAEGELKPKSFRISEDTAEKFKEIANQLGGNQQTALSKLIQTYELQSGKEILSDKKADIEEFENLVTALTNKYMNSLESNQNMQTIVRAEFESLLTSKDTTIADLQSQLATAKDLKAEATAKSKELTDRNLELEQSLNNTIKERDERYANYESIIEDKEEMISTLREAYTELKSKVETMAADIENAKNLSEENTKLKHDNINQDMTIKGLEANISSIKADKDKIIAELKESSAQALQRNTEQAELDKQKAILDIERKYQAEIEKLKAEKQAEVDKYQSKYMDLLEQLKNN